MNITIYTTPTCVFCRQLKEYLTEKGIEYVEKNVSADTEAAKEMVELSNQMGVPVVVIEKDGSREVIEGFDKKRLEDILG